MIYKTTEAAREGRDQLDGPGANSEQQRRPEPFPCRDRRRPRARRRPESSLCTCVGGCSPLIRLLSLSPSRTPEREREREGEREREMEREGRRERGPLHAPVSCPTANRGAARGALARPRLGHGPREPAVVRDGDDTAATRKRLGSDSRQARSARACVRACVRVRGARPRPSAASPNQRGRGPRPSDSGATRRRLGATRRRLGATRRRLGAGGSEGAGVDGHGGVAVVERARRPCTSSLSLSLSLFSPSPSLTQSVGHPVAPCSLHK